MTSVVARVHAAFDRMVVTRRPEIWITLRPREDLLTAAKELDNRVHDGENLPLAGQLVAVKDNIDVAELPTTAGCPAYSFHPESTAPAIARLLDAGALILGKTNMDQFATGLVGTRSPYGAVRNAYYPSLISGGSSSGSAVAVALGIADIGIGTDTAGSGRVPAAFNAIVGVKPTLGLIANTGVVPACRSYDSITAFATTLPLAWQAIETMTGPGGDPRGRDWPAEIRPAGSLLAIPEELPGLSPSARTTFEKAVENLRNKGIQTRTVDINALLAAAVLLYDGALVAERYAAVGKFIDEHPADIDPSVRTIISAAGTIPAHVHVADLERLDHYRVTAAEILAGCDALLLPTAPRLPSIAEVAADPLGVNRELGMYTNFVNLLDMAAIAVPAGLADGTPFGVSVITRAFDDRVAYDIASSLLQGKGTL